jgi:hypothetical protein
MDSEFIFQITIGPGSAERPPETMKPLVEHHRGSFRSECMMDAVRSPRSGPWVADGLQGEWTRGWGLEAQGWGPGGWRLETWRLEDSD